MGEFRGRYPVETEELDAAVEAADGYRELHQRLTDDDLPRFQQQFKTYLNKEADVIRQRIATINESLVGVDYNPGRYIKLEAQPTPHTDVREFRAELRACTEGAVSAEASDQYSEQKFLQVSRIVEIYVIEPYVSAPWLRGQPDELLLPAADADDRGVLLPPARARGQPQPGDAIVIFGGGYAVDVLESLGWLTDLDLVYWGDMRTTSPASPKNLENKFDINRC
ncbi:MAG TPA: Wadjet anti-phage system protein JetD domain-containing protein [Streptosporangiaceae bacterium]